ncbi:MULTISPECIES: DUF1080 domain-containing protein [Aliiglaciecola]|uniref:3-keto-disaccharide hydrolase n=2 Tax=Aliiglaciecola TaxID=1406885 RepID=UPI0020912C5A|nr:DUF1080 domain-containing protein [Aliiglaciecola lipolytica]
MGQITPKTEYLFISCFSKIPLMLAIGFALSGGQSIAGEAPIEPWQQAEKTEVWKPVPKVISASENRPPSDAIVLFDGTDLSRWRSLSNEDAKWIVENGSLTVNPGAGDIKTVKEFCDIQLHLEWKTPTEVAGLEGQQRHNSGVFLQQRYEIQILDSYNNQTYVNGQAASVYKQSIPLVNAMRPAGQWQVYDIIYKAPKFNGDRLTSPAFITVLHNGVVVQNHTEIKGKTEWIGAPSYEAHGCAPIQLQDHGNKVSFRNIWLRELKNTP